MFKKLSPHMPGPKGSVAEEFKLTNEAKFKAPTLEEMYWENPNSARGTMYRCTQAQNNQPDTPRLYDTSPIKEDYRTSEGI